MKAGRRGTDPSSTTRAAWIVIAVLAAFGFQEAPGQNGSRPVDGPASRASAHAEDIAARYGGVAQRIITTAILRNEGWEKLQELCDGIGHRLSGSPALERAVAWSVETMKKSGLENVRAEKVMVPCWVRGEELVELVEPRSARLPALALGGSVGTGPDALVAPVVAVRSFDELDQLGEAGVKGKIVVFNVPYDGYGKTVQFRSNGPSRAAKHGAVGALVRSAGPSGLRTPHTGALRYADDAPKIPAAAISSEDAAMLGRLAGKGEPVKVSMKLGCESRPDAESANVVGELLGATNPDEIVLVGGHLDSWDVGQGAQDDGGGVVTSLEAVAHLKRLGLRPRRTIRVVFFTNEENGLRGAHAYRERHLAELGKHVLAIETDGGLEKPIGFGFQEKPARDADPTPRYRAAAEKLRGVVGLLASIGADSLSAGGGGADIDPMRKDGVFVASIETVGTRYFEWHHTEADTIDKIDPTSFNLHVAALAVVLYVVADLPERL
jgi:carboxypeptidase Q